MYDQRGQRRKFQGLNRGQLLNCDLNRGLSLNRGRRWTEISASHRFPVRAKPVPRRDQTIATSQN
jgi:hypothetical protein